MGACPNPKKSLETALGVQDVGAAVQAWAAEMQSRAEQQGVTIQLEAHTTVGLLAFHPSTLRRAVLNVVQNAIEAMPQRAPLRHGVCSDRHGGASAHPR